MKNREYLAKMTNKELAEFLTNEACCYCAFQQIDCYSEENDYNCSDGILQWLNAERGEE